MEIRKRILELEHPDTLSSFNTRQRIHDAIGLIEKPFKLRHSVLGPSHTIPPSPLGLLKSGVKRSNY
ncbi:hypothetical protein ASPSYDRAFT_52599 [Aspergillus sydowii CBS 593.65]|uniref:Uncharacterized protein n=1 Tax=Aspergillus sydowii CBS 593.65 TaxID=1036612 RepID=A0A1L9SY40_9EURO|nr:uncharacterized protein ASPSYDRAFT_52599 [Aspergillus sydowii CBS 593.65]OJJ51991.1 hypothetical protein ASPSYDRAFT_52599 [Aspergillus sydowii CBS 593.65]